jgi:drug/metabolite transporter (DMT)-like permease
MTATDVRVHRLGVGLVTASAVVWSMAGLFTRLIAADTWTLVFWRSAFGALFIAAVLVGRERRGLMLAFPSMGGPGWSVAILETVAMISYLCALRLTAVADVMIVYATVPFVVAALAWLVTRERASRPTLVASAIATAGVAVTLGGAALAGNVWGNVLAFVMTLAYAAILVILRQHREVTMVAAVCVSMLLSTAVTWPLSAPTAVGSPELFYLFLFGGQMGLGLLLLTIGSRLIPATENALIGTLDTPLSPLWVWLAVDEVPTTAALVGGTIVLGAVIGHIVAEGRRNA